MPVPERAPKPAPARSKSAPNLESAQSPSAQPQPLELASPAMMMSLQRAIGNHAVQRMLMPHKPTAIQRIPFEDADTPAVDSAGSETIQRQIKKIAGASSGWFRKGNRDKINDMVDAYNMKETSLSGSKRSAASYQTLLPDIQKIWQAARAWQMDVMKKNPDKAAEIGLWIKNEVEREEDAKNAQINELTETAALKASWDGAAYNAAYTTPEFTKQQQGAGVRWLQTPDLAPIYRYFMIQIQFEGPTVNAFEDVTRYARNPNRDEALRIYDKYSMKDSSQLNITGEGPKVGGPEAIAGVRRQFEALRADPTAAAPADFGPIGTSLTNVVNEMFTAFRDTDPFKKVTTPPPAPVAPAT